MRRPLSLTLLLIAVLAPLSFTVGCKEQPVPRVLLISLDGWRWDYRDRMDTPALDAIAAAGVSARQLQPAFPSKTFPNHFTLVTGLVPDHHGVVSNTMRDPAMPGTTFSMSNRDAVRDARWWLAEPIWTTLEKAGRSTAPLLWPGSEAPIGGAPPSRWMGYDDKLTDADRVAMVVDLYDGPESTWPAFATMYWPDVDWAGHEFGPESEEVRKAAERLDGAIGDLRRRLETLDVADELHVVIVSDHGMSQLSPDRVIYLEDYIDLDAVETVDSTPNLGMYPKTLTADEIYARMRGRHPHLQVYRPGEFPERLRFGTHPRVPPVYLSADEGWTIMARRGTGRSFSFGTHGYDNQALSMQGLFIAAGPSLKRGLVIDRYRSVDVYELLCRLVGIEPRPNDGDPAAARRLLR